LVRRCRRRHGRPCGPCRAVGRRGLVVRDSPAGRPGRGAVGRAGSVPRRPRSDRPVGRRPRWPDQTGIGRRPNRTPTRSSVGVGSGTPGPTPVKADCPAPRAWCVEPAQQLPPRQSQRQVPDPQPLLWGASGPAASALPAAATTRQTAWPSATSSSCHSKASLLDSDGCEDGMSPAPVGLCFLRRGWRGAAERSR